LHGILRGRDFIHIFPFNGSKIAQTARRLLLKFKTLTAY